MGYNSWGRKEPDTTERLTLTHGIGRATGSTNSQ